MQKKNMTTKRLIAILLCIFAFFGTVCLVFNLNYRLPYVECNDGFEYVDTVFEPITMTKEEAKREDYFNEFKLDIFKNGEIEEDKEISF